MGMRSNPGADVPYPYICSMDTALPRPLPELLIPCDAELREATSKEIVEWLYSTYPECTFPRSAFNLLADRDSLIEAVATQAAKARHKAYEESGDESTLGALADDVIRWMLCIPEPRIRAEAKGKLTQTPDGVSDYLHTYNVSRWLLRRTLKGATGWDAFVADKDGFVSESCLDKIDEAWVIELGSHALESATLRKHEKKVSS